MAHGTAGGRGRAPTHTQRAHHHTPAENMADQQATHESNSEPKDTTSSDKDQKAPWGRRLRVLSLPTPTPGERRPKLGPLPSSRGPPLNPSPPSRRHGRVTATWESILLLSRLRSDIVRVGLENHLVEEEHKKKKEEEEEGKKQKWVK